MSIAKLSWNANRQKHSTSLPMLALGLMTGVCLLQIQPVLQVASQLNLPVALKNSFQGPIWTSSEMLFFLPVSLWAFYWIPRHRFMWMLIMGYLWALLFAQIILQQQLPNAFIGKDIMLEGVIIGLPDKKDRSIRFDFEVKRYLSVGKKVGYEMNEMDELLLSKLPSHIKLSWYYYKNKVYTGEHWRLLVRLKPPHGMQNTGGFDYEKWLYQQGVMATGYVRKSKVNRALGKVDKSADSIRENIQLILANLPDDTYHGLLQALTIGHKSAITQQQWSVLRNTGTSHLMAISGLHIGLVAGLVFLMVRRIIPAFICNLISAPQLAAIVSLAIAGFYASLAGFSVPTQRAFIMLLVVMLAILIKRPGFSLETLAFALIVVLIINPNAVLSVGFWLSFIAVLIISFISSARVNRKQAAFMAWLQGVKIQWLIALSMMPLSVLLFQQGSMISPVANMLVIPLIGFLIVPLSLLASLISFVSAESSLWLFTLTSEILSWIWLLLAWLSQPPYASWQSLSVPLLHAGLALIGGVMLLMPRGFPMRYSGLILFLPMLLYQVPRPKQGEFWVDVIDVGQGLSVLVQTANKSLLYDVGAKFSERFDIGSRVVIPYLNTLGIKQLDVLMISHGDNDHAGGADSLLDMIDVEQILAEQQVAEVKKRPNRFDKSCKQGMHWQWNDVKFAIIHPNLSYKKSNNRSCVLKVWNKDYSLLLPGDIEARAESTLLQYNAQILQSDILLVPHHGSNTSSSAAWLKKVAPKLAIVSAGYKNRFKHPTAKVLARYRSMGIQVLNTANTGMIQLKVPASVDDGMIEFNLQRKSSMHYWNHRLDNVLYE